MRKRGVNARNGMVRLIGETFKAFVYKIIAVISSGSAHIVANQKVLFRYGISINRKLIKSTGSENSSRTHATKYSSLEASTLFVSASLVAKVKAVNNA
jgi:hypothetical protein